MRKLIFILIALISFSQAQTIQYIGGPTTTVISRGNFRADSIFYLPKRTKTPMDTAAFRYQISDSSLYYWTGYQWMKVGNNQDTASMLSNYVRGSGTINYIPKFNSTRSVVNSKLYESNLNLLFNSTTPYLTTSGISTIENNGTSAALYVLKTLDTARAYVSFGGANTMDINNLRAGDIRFYTNATLRGRFQTDGTFRLNSLTGTGNRIVVADDNGVLSATSSATGLVDTTLLSTRAYRQKGDDSLGAIIATKGSGTVTSVATGYGLSGGTITTTGTLIADTLNLSTRAWRQKGLDSLAALEISGNGTTNYVAKFTNTRELGNSQIFDNGTNVGIGTTSPNAPLNIKVLLSGNDPALNIEGSNTLPLEFTDNAQSTDLRKWQLGTNSQLFYFRAVNDSRSSFTAIFNAYRNGVINFLGNVGISTASPSYKLDISGNIRNTTEAYFNTSSGESYFGTTTDAGNYRVQVSGNAYVTGTSVLAATNGEVLIRGTNNPLADVNRGNITLNGTLSNIVAFTNGSTATGYLFQSTTDMQLFNNTATGNLRFFTNATEYMRITSSGNIGIGTTSPGYKLDVLASSGSAISSRFSGNSSTNNNTQIRIYGVNSASDLWAIGNAVATNDATRNFDIFDLVSGSNRFRINSAGEILFNTITDAGDYNLQNNGSIYNSGGAYFSVTSGSVGIGNVSPTGKLDIYETSTVNQQLVLRNNGTYHTGLIGTSTSNPLTDTYAWGIFGGPNSYVSGISNSVSLSLSSNVSSFQITKNNNLNSIPSSTLFYVSNSTGIVGIATTSPNASAQLDVTSTTRGFLPPRMTSTQRDAISSPAAGLVIYNTTTSKLQVYTTSWTDLH